VTARLPGDGKDFDDQWNESRRQGEAKAAKGEGPWAYDKALEKYQQSMDASGAGQSGPRHAASDNCVIALAALGGLAWAVAEGVGRVLT
jgi:hypothetical protein